MAQASALDPFRFTREQYDRMVDVGVLEDLPVELLDGVIVAMTPQGDEHSTVILRLMRLLAPAVTDERLRVQMPLAATPDSEPEPDLALADTPAPGRGHPATAELVIEVVVTRREARVKERIYARAGVPAYWIVDVPERTVSVLERPEAAAYTRRRVLRGDDRLVVPAYGVSTTVAALLS